MQLARVSSQAGAIALSRPLAHLRHPAAAPLGLRRTAGTIASAAAKGPGGPRALVATDAPDVSTSSAPVPEPLRVDSGREASSSSSNDASSSSGGGGGGAPGAEPQGNLLRVAWRRVLRELSSLPRAIGIMATIAVLSGLGTVIPQNKSLEFYMEKYPEGPSKVLGFLSYDVLLGLQLDHIYSAWYFYGMIGLLGASLMACTATTQWPTAKVAQRWRFASDPQAVQRAAGAPASVLPNARLSDLGSALAARGYQVFRKGPELYAFKGLAGRLGPIGVHAALLLTLFGTAYSGFGGWHGSAMVPEGQEFLVASAISPTSFISTLPRGASAVLHVDGFRIETRPDGSVAQFYSDLSLRDLDSGDGLLAKTISVNDPFRWGGVTMYQTDWSLSSVVIRVPSSSLSRAGAEPTQPSPAPSEAVAPGQPVSLPLASLAGKGGTPANAKLWATFLPTEPIPQDGRAPRGISMVVRDMQLVTFYDSKGAFAGVRRAGSGKPIEVEGVELILDQIVGATGLEIKADPGVPYVYAGFAGVMLTTLVSYVSHSQVWGLQDGGAVVVAGRSNRSKVTFDRELDNVLDAVPEVASR